MLLLVSGQPAGPGLDWTTYVGDPARSGVETSRSASCLSLPPGPRRTSAPPMGPACHAHVPAGLAIVAAESINEIRALSEFTKDR